MRAKPDGARPNAKHLLQFDAYQRTPAYGGAMLTHNTIKRSMLMSHTPHELHEEFPDKADAISNLKQTDAHFAKIADEYHEVNRAVHRAETNIEPMDSLAEVELRKQRAALKDEIWAYLSKA
jgi:uncharacterized protein YdcH (DUF465 family)